ncbi:hypothetical protein HAX54_026106, partial [Datura stramonium]|nr:hypothetical protein [Datura stramonium]
VFRSKSSTGGGEGDGEEKGEMRLLPAVWCLVDVFRRREGERRWSFPGCRSSGGLTGEERGRGIRRRFAGVVASGEERE